MRMAGAQPAALSQGVGGRYQDLAAAIARWNADQAATRVIYGGRTTFTQSTNLNGGTGSGRTLVGGYVTEGMLQDGYIRTIDAEVSQVGTANGWKFKLFRPDGSGNYNMVAETETFTPAGTGTRTFTPATPLGPCQPGDRVGLWIIGTNGGSTTRAQVFISSDAASSCYYSDGDLSTLTAPTLVDDFSLNIRFNGIPPFLIGTGDSRMEGHNSATPWHGWRHTGPTGTPAAEVLNQMRALVPTLEYQNYGRGSEKWDQLAAAASAIAAKAPYAVLVQCGVNDVSTGRAWVDIEANMDTFLAAMPAGTRLFIDEVLPWTNGNDTQAAAVRDLNTNYAAWCAANGAILVSSHDQMGKTRVSTGELDDLKTEYDYDGLHLSLAGVDAWAGLLTAAMEANVYEAETTALVSRFTVPPTSERKVAINDVVKSLKDAGVWSKLDAFYVYAGADSQAARQNWVANQYNAVAVNAPTFTVDRGYTPDGSTSYLDTGFNPTTAASPKFVQDNCHMGAWHLTDLDNGGASSFDNGNGPARIINTSALSTQFRSQSGTNVTVIDDYAKHKVWSRSGAAAREYYNDGVGTSSGTEASTTLTNFAFGVGRTAAAAAFGRNQCAVYHFGSNLTADNVSAIKAALRTYLTAVGVP